MITDQTKFTFTLNKLVLIIVAVVGSGFTVGMSYQAIIPNKTIQEKNTKDIADIKLTLERVVTVLENMQESQKETEETVKDNSKNISSVQSRQHVMISEVEIIASDIKELERKR